jgi:eukaryotic-like serine/threonine-protein kinase
VVPEELKNPASSTAGYIDPLAGTRYRTLALLGRGGMGEVVEAEHLGLGKRVVVKLLRPELAAVPELVQRMQIEARSLAAVVSPHVVQVSDFGQTADGRTYLVMERLYGRTLAAELEARGALPIAEAIGYVIEVLAGLDAAHAMGIVHRDIKPENVFLCDPSRDAPRTVKILDFGIAKVLNVAVEGRGPALPHLATENGALVGTPRVVSPEQARGKPVDPRADLYSVGLLLYTIVAGRGPFADLRDPVALLKAHVEERPVPPSRHAHQPVHPMLDAAILRALEKRPEDRFQSAMEFAAELRCILAAMKLGPALAFATTELSPRSGRLVPGEGSRPLDMVGDPLRGPLGPLPAEPSGPPTPGSTRSLHDVPPLRALPLATGFVPPSAPRFGMPPPMPQPEEQRTLRLPATEPTPPPTQVPVVLEAQAEPARAASLRTLVERLLARRRTGWGAFVALALLSALVSTVLLVVLYRATGP